MRPSLTRTLPRLIATLAATASSSLSCQEEEPERFPTLSDRCGGEPCENGLPPGGGIGTPEVDDDRGGSGAAGSDPTGDGGGAGGTPANNGAGATPGSAGADAGGFSVLTGTVKVATSADLQGVIPLDDARVEIIGFSPDGSREQTTYGANEEFTLQLTGWPARVSVRQTTGNVELMTTTQWVNESGPTELLIVQRTVLADIADNLANNATFLDGDRGHAFVNFYDSLGAPLIGINAQLEGAVVGYDIGIFYSDAEEQTAERGGAVLINAPAAPFPGNESNLVVRYVDQRLDLPLQLAADTVTIKRVDL